MLRLAHVNLSHDWTISSILGFYHIWGHESSKTVESLVLKTLNLSLIVVKLELYKYIVLLRYSGEMGDK